MKSKGTPLPSDPKTIEYEPSISGAPLLQVFERAAKVLEDLAIIVLDLACWRHDRDKAGKSFDDQPEAVFAGPRSQSFKVPCAWIG
jgi:hypothetical protein